LEQLRPGCGFQLVFAADLVNKTSIIAGYGVTIKVEDAPDLDTALTSNLRALRR
jgi:hypothetical protein